MGFVEGLHHLDAKALVCAEKHRLVDGVVQAVQPGAVAQAVPAASLEGKDRHRLLSDWMDALEQSMAS